MATPHLIGLYVVTHLMIWWIRIVWWMAIRVWDRRTWSVRGLRILISTPSCTWRCRYYIIIEIHTIASKLILQIRTGHSITGEWSSGPGLEPLNPQRWRDRIPETSTALIWHNIAFQKTSVFNYTSVKTSNLTNQKLFSLSFCISIPHT